MPAGRRGDEASARGSAALILDYHPAASAEMIEAGRFYDDRSIGLGHRFLDAVDASLATIQPNPMLGNTMPTTIGS